MVIWAQEGGFCTFQSCQSLSFLLISLSRTLKKKPKQQKSPSTFGAGTISVLFLEFVKTWIKNKNRWRRVSSTFNHWATLPHLWLSENSQQSVTENISSGINSLNQYDLKHKVLIIICLAGSLNNRKYKSSSRYYWDFFHPPTSGNFWQKQKELLLLFCSNWFVFTVVQHEKYTVP